jgi:carboxyl-terminal processing protease
MKAANKTIRLLLIICIYSLVLSNMRAQKDVSFSHRLNSMLDHAQSASLYRQNVNWSKLRNEVLERAGKMASMQEMQPAFNYLLEAIGDEHGKIFFQQNVVAYYFGGLKDHHNGFDVNIYNAIQSGQKYSFEVKILGPDIGYVRLCGMPMGDNYKMAEELGRKICYVQDELPQNWVLDLRYNGGGNMFPMAEALVPLLGEGPAGGTDGIADNEDAVWQVIDEKFYYGNFSLAVPKMCLFSRLPKIAVLTSMYTTSSGEAIAVMFKGRDHTRFLVRKPLA